MTQFQYYQYVHVGLASPEQIKEWAQRLIPNGEIVGRVTKPNTIHYKSHKPERDGLFCERIFGPIKSGMCFCGKYQGNIADINNIGFCEQCGVELTDARVRRYRMGYIELGSSVTHIWYLKNRPSYIAQLLQIPLKDLENLIYCDSFIIGPNFKSKIKLLGNITAKRYEVYLKLFFKKKRLSSLQKKKLPDKIDLPRKYKIKHQVIYARKKILRLANSYITEPSILSSMYSINWLQILEIYLSKWFIIFHNREIFTGADAVKNMLSNLNLEKKLISLNKNFINIIKQNEKIFEPSDSVYSNIHSNKKKYNSKFHIQKNTIFRCIKTIKDLLNANIKPEWMVLSVIPVLPPDLRPIVELKNGQLITSDLNELYRRVLFRNEELLIWLSCAQRSIPPAGLFARLQREGLQRAVDALLANGMSGSPFKDINRRIYKSFSSLINGKKGRFRENLLGKRVDYSGRSVIIVSPSLAIYQCGLPKEMAIELFQPFVIKELINRKIVQNLRSAKNLIQKQKNIIWRILQQVIQSRLVILNRAPTLHRLGMQAFKPILVKERAIHLHPLVCSGFNADFDGDQMAVHVPLSWESQVESAILMWSQINILSPANGHAITVPSQDMLLGIYVLTLENSLGIQRQRHKHKKKKFQNKTIPVFNNFDDILLYLNYGKIDFSSFICFFLNKEQHIVISIHQDPLEHQYHGLGHKSIVYPTLKKTFCQNNVYSQIHIFTTVGRIVFNQQISQAIDDNHRKFYL